MSPTSYMDEMHLRTAGKEVSSHQLIDSLLIPLNDMSQRNNLLGINWDKPTHTECVCIFSRVYGRVGIVCLISLTRGGASSHQLGGKVTPLGIAGLLLDDGAEVKGVRKDIGLCARVTDKPLSVQLLGDSHGLFRTDP